MLYLLAIGKKHNFNYLQYLSDDYSRERAKNIDKSLKINKWIKNHKFVQSVKNVKILNGSTSVADLCQHAVASFPARVCPNYYIIR